MNKKVFFIINNLGVGGAERLVVDDINEMLKRGISVKLITLKNESKTSLSVQCAISRDDWKIIPFKSFFDVPSWFNLIGFIRVYKPDLIITHLWFANTIGRIAAHCAGFKKIISFEQNVYDRVKNKRMFFIDRVLQSWCVRVIAVSEVVKKSLLVHGIKEKNIDVIYNSIDTLKYKKAILAKNIPIDKNGFKFLYIGRLIQQKGVDVLIKAFARISNATLYIVGQGIEESVLKEIVKKEGVEDRVFFVGVRNDVPSLMKTCDCFVYPSRYDGLSLVLLEALSAGMPIIASDIEANVEVIKNGENGILVPVDDILHFFIAMEKIIKNPALRERMSINAMKRAEDFSIEKHVAKLITYAT